MIAKDHQRSTTAEVIDIRLDSLLMLPGNQIRTATCQKTAKQYADLMMGGDQFPPIRVATTDGSSGDKGYTLIDGWHRVTAAQRNGSRTIRAIVVKGSPEEIPWLAAEANRRHGLPLSRADKRNVFRAYVKAKRHRKGRGKALKSAREMAKDLNGIVSRHQLPKWMQSDFPAIYAAMNCDDGDIAEMGLKPADMDKEYARVAVAKLDEFMACMRAMSSNKAARAVCVAAAARVTEVSEAVTGSREWPKAAVDLGDF